MISGSCCFISKLEFSYKLLKENLELNVNASIHLIHLKSRVHPH